MDFIIEHKELLFSGLGTAMIVFFLQRILSKKAEGQMQEVNEDTSLQLQGDNNLTIQDSNLTIQDNNSPIQNTQVTVNVNNESEKTEQDSIQEDTKYASVSEAQKNVNILFIDDDTKFKVINILKKSGWINTRILKDISNLDSSDLKNTDIFFIDIQGVGKKLGFQDEGLGLANALKKKYSEKKVVIYSAETRGDRFHEALRNADDFLSKNAEPFQFQQTIEQLCVK